MRSVNRIRVLLADGDVGDLPTRAAALAGKPQIDVVGVSSDGAEALSQVAACRPDLVVLDVRLPPMGGFEAARRIKAGGSAAVVVLVTYHVGELARRAAAGAGADLVVAKAEMIDRIAAIALRMAIGIEPA
jgi:DNA-binding NarL/FixJ family response regulator